MFHQVLSYLKWLPASFRLHGIHSPQIFDFQHHCLLANTPPAIREELFRFRESVYNDHTMLEVTDHGAGSRVFTDGKRSVSEMAKSAGSTQKRTELLYRICKYLNPKNVLELGTSTGLATHALARAQPNANIVTVEGSGAIHQRTASHLDKAGVQNVELINSTFHEFLDQPDLPDFDLIFIDGHHQGEATIAYWQKCLELANEETLFIFDDIYWSRDMTEAWKIICKDERSTAVVDTFFWGLVFIDPRLHKQVYNIRL